MRRDIATRADLDRLSKLELVDRIEALEALLGVDRSLTGRLREAYRLEPLHAQMLGMFLMRDFVTRDGLYTVLYEARPECEWPEEKILDVQLCKLRAHMKRNGHADAVDIKTKHGEGWEMAKAAKAVVWKRLNGPPDAVAAIPPSQCPPLAPGARASVLEAA